MYLRRPWQHKRCIVNCKAPVNFVNSQHWCSATLTGYSWRILPCTIRRAGWLWQLRTASKRCCTSIPNSANEEEVKFGKIAAFLTTACISSYHPSKLFLLGLGETIFLQHVPLLDERIASPRTSQIAGISSLRRKIPSVNYHNYGKIHHF